MDSQSTILGIFVSTVGLFASIVTIADFFRREPAKAKDSIDYGPMVQNAPATSLQGSPPDLQNVPAIKPDRQLNWPILVSTAIAVFLSIYSHYNPYINSNQEFLFLFFLVFYGLFCAFEAYKSGETKVIGRFFSLIFIAVFGFQLIDYIFLFGRELWRSLQ